MADLRKQLKDLRTSGLDIFAVQAEVDRIAGEFLQVLQTELVAIGKQQPASASASPQPSATASPATSTSPSVEPTPTASGSPTPTTTATP